MMCYSSDFTRTSRSEREAEVEQQKRAIEVTAAFGGKFCRVLSGQRRPGIERDEGIRMVAECINACIPFAERAGVTLILENHYKDAAWRWPEFAQKEDVFLELLDRIPESPWFGVNFDPSNALVAGRSSGASRCRQAPGHDDARERSFSRGRNDRRPRASRCRRAFWLCVHPPPRHHWQGAQRLRRDPFDAERGRLSRMDQHRGRAGSGFRYEDLRLSAEFLRAKMAEYGLA